MAELNSSTTYTATATMSNPTTKAFDYAAMLFLGIDKVATAEASFHLEAGESKPVSFSIVTPAVGGTYPVYIHVSAAGVDLGLYQATEDVVISALVPPVSWTYSDISCSVVPSGIGGWPMVNFQGKITNQGSSQATKIVMLYRRDWTPVWNELSGQFVWQWGPWAVAITNEGTAMQFELTLSAEQWYQVIYPPVGEHSLISADPGTMSELYLVDSDGGESIHCTCVV